jgi:anti-sigma factor RsiW
MTSDCTTTRELIAADVDGDLSPTRRSQLDAHLTACGDCRLVAARLGRAVALLERLPKPEPGPVFVTETLRRARLARQAQETRARRLMRLWALVALTLGATALASLRALGVWDAAGTWLLAIVPGCLRLIEGLSAVFVSLGDALAPVAQGFLVGLVEIIGAVIDTVRAVGRVLLAATLPPYVAALVTIACLAVLGRSRFAAPPAIVEKTL